MGTNTVPYLISGAFTLLGAGAALITTHITQKHEDAREVGRRSENQQNRLTPLRHETYSELMVLVRETTQEGSLKLDDLDLNRANRLIGEARLIASPELDDELIGLKLELIDRVKYHLLDTSNLGRSDMKIHDRNTGENAQRLRDSIHRCSSLMRRELGVDGEVSD